MAKSLIRYGDSCHVNKPGDAYHGKMGLVMGEHANGDIILRFVDKVSKAYNPSKLDLFVQVNEFDIVE